MSDRDTLTQDGEAVLRAHGAALLDLANVFQEADPPYRQFSLHLDESMLDEFLTFFKKVVYFATFARAPQVSTQVSSKYDSWEWAKQHAQMFMEAPTGFF